MKLDLNALSDLILALVAVGGLYSGHVLSKRSKTKENELQAAANQLAERVQVSNEVNAYADRLERENERLRAQAREDAERFARDLERERELGARRHEEYLEIRSLVVGQVREEAAKTAGEPIDIPPPDDDEGMGP